jgi:hypothetical protein
MGGRYLTEKTQAAVPDTVELLRRTACHGVVRAIKLEIKTFNTLSWLENIVI